MRNLDFGPLWRWTIGFDRSRQLRIELLSELPEATKPRRIPIGGSAEQITHKQAA
jgi:hypothetical protein